jgi:hypothetical protein
VIRAAATEARAHFVGEQFAASEHERFRERHLLRILRDLPPQPIRQRAVPRLRMPARQRAFVHHQLRRFHADGVLPTLIEPQKSFGANGGLHVDARRLETRVNRERRVKLELVYAKRIGAQHERRIARRPVAIDRRFDGDEAIALDVRERIAIGSIARDETQRQHDAEDREEHEAPRTEHADQ